MKLFCLKFILFLSVLFSCHFSVAQSPEGINYQAALRDSESGETLRNQMVFIVLTIRSGGPAGEVVYAESHSGIATNDFGLINLIIGGGDATDGSFDEIPWSGGDIWYEIEIDSGSGLESLGITQFLSVPYALFAGNAQESLDNDPTNELIDSASFNQETQSLTIQEGENEVSFTLDGLNVNDADADPSNELIVAAEYDLETNSILITQADGSVVNVSLSDLNLADGDSDPTNELISNAVYDSQLNAIVLTQADGSEVNISLADLNVADNDADPTNERMDGVQLSGTTLVITEAGQNYSTNLDALLIEGITLTDDTILTITESGIEHSVNLSPLMEDDDWKIDDDNERVYNDNDKIGIGTNEPAARLEVVEASNTATALSVKSGTESMLQIANERVGVASTNLLSTVQFGGSLGYDITLLDNGESDNYTAGIDDHMIVVSFQSGGNSEFGIFLPPADVCTGRVYIIRKTGQPGSIGDVTVDTGSFPIDFDDPDLLLDENNPETVVLLSLGINGWTRVLEN